MNLMMPFAFDLRFCWYKPLLKKRVQIAYLYSYLTFAT